MTAKGDGLNIAGERYGRLVAVRVAEYSKGRRWLCKCDCGADVTYLQSNLRQGSVKSCGCLRRELGKSKPRITTHGMSGRKNRHPLYGLWNGMLQRCRSPKNAAYADYGGRGIQVCDRWLGAVGLANFIADMGPRPAGTSLDRIDVNGNYEPSNCRWATAEVQSRNRRDTRVSPDLAESIRGRVAAGERRSDVARSLGLEFKHVRSAMRLANRAVNVGEDAAAMAWGIL